MTDRERQRRMMLSPMDWPRWPVLPLKRPEAYNDPGREDLGLLVAWQGHLTTVYFANLGELGKGTFAEVFGKLPQRKYADVDAILDAGWKVD